MPTRYRRGSSRSSSGCSSAVAKVWLAAQQRRQAGAWYSLAGTVVGTLLAGLALLLFGILHPRYRAPNAQKGLGATLPADLAQEIAEFPE